MASRVALYTKMERDGFFNLQTGARGPRVSCNTIIQKIKERTDYEAH